MPKKYLNKNVYDATLERLDFIFNEFEKICVSFSGGKDSTVLLHLTMQEARKRNKLPIYALFIDLEGQYRATIEHIKEVFDYYGSDLQPFWICLPLNLRNAVSAFHPYWCCWDPEQREYWCRDMPAHPSVISDQSFFPFYKFRMEFEEFVPKFQEWLADGRPTACLVGIRSDESLNRYKAVKREQKKCAYKKIKWTSKFKAKDHAVACYPIYDWRFEDLWKYIHDNNLPYNRLYDLMYLAGVPFPEMRICQPYGDDQRKGLDMFHKIEPDTWFRIVRRVEGANWGALYARQKFLGYKGSLGLPPTFSSWKQYVDFLLRTMPEDLRKVYLRRIKVFFDWWAEHDYPLEKVPDEGDIKLTGKKKQPSWRRIALSILKMDMGRSLSFGFCRKDTDRLIKIKQKYANL